ncbi:MAG: tRNA (adenosine(37)-N6)-dimethylallyltransferase MiaA [Verrucomicrobiota bacterium]
MTGPTGAGKSAFAVALAEKIQGEIVGADAFQIYAGLPILTAQPAPDLLARVPHHLIGILPPESSCDAARYASLAKRAIREIQSRARTPVLTGGTGLYLKALTHGLAEMQPVDASLRKNIAEMSLPEALAHLRDADADAPDQIDQMNPARVRRALEIVLSTGKPLSASRTTWKSASKDFAGILLERDRCDLRLMIAANVDAMFAAGVVEEVRRAGDVGPGLSRAIGFREIQELIAGRIAQPECRDRIVTATRRYAKRQLTWCRHQFNFPTINLTPKITPDELLESALRLMGGSDA